MYLVAVEERADDAPQEQSGKQVSSDRWRDFPISELSHHGSDCCEIARHWVVAMDLAQLNGGDRLSGPRWLRARYEWGPSAWPMHWCELVERKIIDCGAHSALAHVAFQARGVPAFRAQFIQRYSQDAQAQWRARWGADKVSDHWIADDVIYHEGNAILVGEDEVKLWDSSAGAWLNPRHLRGYGSLAAVRLLAEGSWGGGEGLRWGEHRIKPNVWHHFADQAGLRGSALSSSTSSMAS
jgi:hypothetical protein